MPERVDYTINANDTGVERLLKGIGLALEKLEKGFSKISSTATQATTKMHGFVKEGEKIRASLLTPLEKLNQKIERTNFLLQKKSISAEEARQHIAKLNNEYSKLGSTGSSTLTKLVGSMAALNIATNGFRRIFEVIKNDFAITAKLADKIRGKQDEADTHTLSKLIQQSGLSPTQTTQTLAGVKNVLTDIPVAPSLATGMAMQTQIVSSGFADKGNFEALRKYTEFFAVLGETNLNVQDARDRVKSISKFMSAAGAIVQEDGPDKGKMDVGKMDQFLQKFAAIYATREVDPQDLKEMMSNMAVVLRRTNGAIDQSLAALVTILEVSSPEQAGTQLKQIVDKFANLAGNSAESKRHGQILQRVGIDSKELAKLIGQGNIIGAIEVINKAGQRNKVDVDLALDEVFGVRENKGIAALRTGETKLQSIIDRDLNQENVRKNYQSKSQNFATLPSVTQNRLKVKEEYEAMASVRGQGGLTYTGLESALTAASMNESRGSSPSGRIEIARDYATILEIIKIAKDSGLDPQHAVNAMKLIQSGAQLPTVLKAFTWLAAWNNNNFKSLKGNKLLTNVTGEIDDINKKRVAAEDEVEWGTTGINLKGRRIELREEKEREERERLESFSNSAVVPSPNADSEEKTPAELEWERNHPGEFTGREITLDGGRVVKEIAPLLKGGGSSPDRFPEVDIIITEANPNKGALLDAVLQLNSTILERFPKSEVQKIDVGIDANVLTN